MIVLLSSFKQPQMNASYFRYEAKQKPLSRDISRQWLYHRKHLIIMLLPLYNEINYYNYKIYRGIWYYKMTWNKPPR